MSYLDLLNRFYDLLQRSQVSNNAQLLYYTLLQIDNKCSWSDWFSRTNISLCGMMGISENAMKRSRAELKQMGLIDFKPSKRRGESTQYHICGLGAEGKKDEGKEIKPSFCTVQTDTESDTKPEELSFCTVQMDTQSDTQTDTKPDTQSDSINRQRQKQRQKTESPPISPIGRLCEFLSAYPKESNRFLTEREYAALLLTGGVTEDELVQCAQNYAQSCRILGTQKAYIKNAENFLRDFVFEQFLPGNYKKPLPQKPKNTFHNFAQSTTSYDALMQQKLKARMEADGG